ncbi:MAG: hypothetical protein OXU77_03805 [Gammaproteobacteria bacterium]|nr:hypothetical protein [Gammaproteobacteria bacterium]
MAWEIIGYDETEVIYQGELPSDLREDYVGEVLRRLASKHLSHDEILSASTGETERLDVEKGNPMRCGRNPFFIANYIPLGFRELAELLSDACDSSDYRVRDRAMRDFQREHRADIQAMQEQGHTLGDLLDAAKVGEPRPDFIVDMSYCIVCGRRLPVSTTATGALYYGSCEACDNEPRQPEVDSQDSSATDGEDAWDDEYVPF